MGEAFFLGKAIGMLRFYDNPSAISYPATIINIIPAFVKQIKTTETHGYNAISIISKGTTNKTTPRVKKNSTESYENSVPKPIKNSSTASVFCEFRVAKHAIQNFKLDQRLELTKFAAGQSVKVSGLSIGKGFTGNQKRHNFTRGPLTHGSKNYRLPGSIGAGSTPGRVYPGKKMPGRMGHNKVTQRTIVKFSRTKLDFENVSKMAKTTSSLPNEEPSLHSASEGQVQKFFPPVYRDIICLKGAVPGSTSVKNAILKIYI
jgi:large subunit ribosomal protein L3